VKVAHKIPPFLCSLAALCRKAFILFDCQSTANLLPLHLVDSHGNHLKLRLRAMPGAISLPSF
jgi:hypothetical protein